MRRVTAFRRRRCLAEQQAMKTIGKNERLLIANLKALEARGNLEPGTVRAARAALRKVRRASTKRQCDRAIDKLAWIVLRNGRDA